MVAIANGSEELETATITNILSRSEIHVTVVKVIDHDELNMDMPGLDASPLHKICTMSRGLKIVIHPHRIIN